jgi:nicotinamidase-related amidase
MVVRNTMSHGLHGATRRRGERSTARRSSTSWQRDVTQLILTGQVTEQCVLYSALDAYVRHYSVCVPSDAVAPIDPELGDAALTMMQRNMRAEIVTADEVAALTA